MATWHKLVSDDDGHWYVIPYAKEEAFYEYLNKVYDDSCTEVIEEPRWLDIIDGPGSIIFTEYEAS